MLSNAELAELLAREAEKKSGILSRAYRRAARSAFLWPEEVADLIEQNRPLTELRAIGPFITKRILRWTDKPSKEKLRPPAIRRDFIALANAHILLAKNPRWTAQLRGDLQMHTNWSDGAGDIRAMAEAGIARGYEYIAITDHSKGLSIANGLNEAKLKKQSAEIEAVNSELRAGGKSLTILHSIEMNLNPWGEGDMEPSELRSLDIVLGSFHSALRRKDDQTERYLAALRNPNIQILGHPRGRIYNYRSGLRADWERFFTRRPGSIKRWRSTPTPIGKI